MTRRFLGSILLAGGIICWTGLLPAQTIQVNQNNRTIAITVSDKAAADADLATVHVGFLVYAQSADEAYASGSQISNAVIAALEKTGLPAKAIESEGQYLRQNDQFDPKDSDAERAKKRFVLSQSWIVKTTADDAGKALHTAIEAGANASGQIDWDLKDRQGLQTQAAANALVHARAMADQMAKGLNAHLGALIYASNREPQVSGGGGGLAGGMMHWISPAQQKAMPLAIRAQKIEESATVYAVFAIE
jgi:uncharacterized protein YggE